MISRGLEFLRRQFASSRAFALAGQAPDPELAGMLRLGEAAAERDPRLAIALSALTTPRVRALFGDRLINFSSRLGLSFTADGSDVFAATVAAGHLPEARDFRAFMSLVRPGSVIVDVGANFGLYALSAAAYARPFGRVFAFEPAPDAFAALDQNIIANGLAETIAAARTAVADASGKAELNIGRDVSMSSLHRTQRLAASEAVAVDVVSLDEALGDVRSIDLLKIDVEGGEAAVLRGARALLTRSRAPIVQFEFSHKNLDAARWAELEESLKTLSGQGFRLHRRGVDGPAPLPRLEESFSGNLFLAREGDGRLSEALKATARAAMEPEDLAALALLRVVLSQSEELQEADALERHLLEAARSVVGRESDVAPEDAVRAMQRAWLETRSRALGAETAVKSLSQAVEGRDRLTEEHTDKIARLRATNQELQERLANLESKLRDATKARAEKIESMRAAENKMRERVAGLEAAVHAANAKLGVLRQSEALLRQRLDESINQAKTAQQKLARVRKVARRIEDRNRELQSRLSERTNDEPDPSTSA
ncbi:MAG: hypothetical protein A4S17_01890 [Proteobacteria bacterium HN_bin10]|nr:MAG: hypothetical protein A4S17_01890 [Proteobacteria bacterium HN_bin10]